MTKSKILIFITILFISCSELSQSEFEYKSTVLEIHPGDGTSFNDTLIVSRISDSFDWLVSDTVIVAPNTNPRAELSISRPQYVTIFYGELEDRIFVSPESSIQVTINEQNKFENFSGDLVRENSYLQEIKTNALLRELGWSTTEETNADTLEAKLKAYFEVKEGILKEFIDSTDNPFYKLRKVEQEAMYTYAMLSFYENNYENVNLALYDSLSEKRLPEKFFQFGNYTENFESDYYRFLVGKYVLEHFFKQDYGVDWRSRIRELGYANMALETVHQNFPEELERWYNYERLYYLILSSNNANTDRLANTQRLMHEYGQYLSDAKYNELQDLFNESVKTFSQISQGELVPSFMMETETGEPYELKSNGKVVLYDIWASWCKPCFSSFPKVKEIELEYADQLDVISLSFDEDREDHRKTLERSEVPGKTHIIDTNAFQGEFAGHFKIYGIPAYLLVDSEDRILAFGSLDVVQEKIAEIF